MTNIEMISAFLKITVPLSKLSEDEALSEDERALLRKVDFMFNFYYYLSYGYSVRQAFAKARDTL